MRSQLEVRDVTLLYKINGHVPAYLAGKVGQKIQMHIVTAQGIKISYNLPVVQLLLLSIPFFIVQ